MSGGSDFEMIKMQLFNALAQLGELTQNQYTKDRIYMIQKQIAALEEF